VDVVLGPLITFAVFNRSKPRRELVRDLAIVGCIQLAGLSYGLWTVALARPVHLVFEVDRFRVVHAVDVPETQASQEIPQGVTVLPLLGPTVVAVRPFTNGPERLALAEAELAGAMISARPDLWQPYAQAQPRVLKAARPVAELKSRYPARRAEIDQAILTTGRPEGQLLSLPLLARKAYWSVLLDAQTAQIVGFIPLDSF
jgi:hypothetical protein